jgi:hypothetical protein
MAERNWEDYFEEWVAYEHSGTGFGLGKMTGKDQEKPVMR